MDSISSESKGILGSRLSALHNFFEEVLPETSCNVQRSPSKIDDYANELSVHITQNTEITTPNEQRISTLEQRIAFLESKESNFLAATVCTEQGDLSYINTVQQSSLEQISKLETKISSIELQIASVNSR